MQRGFDGVIWFLFALPLPSAAVSQTLLDRSDPTLIERSLAKDPQQVVESREATVATESPQQIVAAQGPRIASAIVVQGASDLPQASFSEVIPAFIGRTLSDRDLRDLATAISDTARKSGFVFATARIEPQRMDDGILRIQLDLGAISAVRVIGSANPYADRILSRALVTGRATRQVDLERAILLVQDIAGVGVKETKYVRQDGFGILLVSITADRYSLYAQFDNRGSDEIGPIRSTLLANLRGVMQAGDEISLISAQTPLAPSEFFFLRGRYTMPLDRNGAMISASVAYGKTRPGGVLEALDVVGESVDATVSVTAPILRSRKRSVWTSVEFRTLESSQTLLGFPFREDRSATVTVAVSGVASSPRGLFRGELSMTAGLPLPGVSREGDARTSRSDGDAHFAKLEYDFTWETRANKHVSFAISSQGQIASRPLLATAEIGVGGPIYGRGYDYSERTGDNGILASAEARYDFGPLLHVVDRAQVYGSLDGGYVENWRHGAGGGGLLSAAGGVRITWRSFDASLEVALPVNSVRFDTGDRQPRVSAKLARSF
ncbi:MAG: ShlB/FhaC/HecB family hemolysin secretion/activation protein [Pseudomonadota bacterium]